MERFRVDRTTPIRRGGGPNDGGDLTDDTSEEDEEHYDDDTYFGEDDEVTETALGELGGPTANGGRGPQMDPGDGLGPQFLDTDDTMNGDGTNVLNVLLGGGGGRNNNGNGQQNADDEAANMAMEDEYEPTDQEITEYCEWLGMDPVIDRQLTWIAREALKAPLPENWKVCYTEDREVYYFNARTGESIWDHPMDAYYKALFKQEKAKLDRKRRHMRLFSGSLEIKPVAEYFSDLADEGGTDVDKEPWTQIPESLIDAIDFRIYVDPVVLPTSGRTVSRHTIINNKWRDPFCREYVENRRLVPNVDKRMEVSNWLTSMMLKLLSQLEPTKASLHRLCDLMPYILDKDDEVSVRAQQVVQQFIVKHSSQPPPRQAAATSAAATAIAAASPAPTAKPAETGTTKAIKGQDPSASKRHGTGKQQQQGSNGATSGGRRANGNTAAMLTVKSRNAANAGGAGKSSQASPLPAVAPPPPPPPPPPSLLELIDDLSEQRKLNFFGSLLTMSTSSSREVLLHLVTRRLAYGMQPIFKGFTEEVLNVLHLSQVDLSRIAAALIKKQTEDEEEEEAKKRRRRQEEQQRDDDDGSATDIDPSATTNDDGGRRTPPQQFPAQQQQQPGKGSATTAANATGGSSPTPRPPNFNASTEMGGSKTASGGGAATVHAPDLGPMYLSPNAEVSLSLQWLHLLGNFENAPANALGKIDFVAAIHLILTIHDTPDIPSDAHNVCTLLRATDGWPQKLCACPDALINKLVTISLKDCDPLGQVGSLYEILLNGNERGIDVLKFDRAGLQTVVQHIQSLASAADYASPSASSSNQQQHQSVDLLAAMLVFHEVLRLEDFAKLPQLALRIGYNLLPRLTRSQWRPKHFDGTVNQIVALIEGNPLAAWQVMRGTAALFLTKELSKKKRNNDEVRVKLGTIEASERRLEQSSTINRWAVLALGLQKRALPSGNDNDDNDTAAGRSPANEAASSTSPVKANTAATTKLPALGGSASRNRQPQPPSSGSSERRSSVAARCLPIAERLNRATKKQNEIFQERAGNIALALQTLLALRLKPKQTRDLSRSNASAATASSSSNASAVAIPPTGAKSTPQRNATPPSSQQQQHNGRTQRVAAATVPTLPPIN